MESETIIELLVGTILLILGFYIAFFKSYYSEKGKNVALKEDIEKLTRKVESIKTEFAKEHEVLKKELERALSNEVSYREEERNALIQFHGIINEWLYSILEIGYGNYNKSNINSLIDARDCNSSFYAKAGVIKSKVELLVEHQDLRILAGKLYIQSLAFHQWTDMELLKLQHNLERQQSLTDRILVLIKNYENNKELAKEMANDESKLKDENKILFDNYSKNRNAEYEKIIPIEQDFKNLVREYLKK